MSRAYLTVIGAVFVGGFAFGIWSYGHVSRALNSRFNDVRYQDENSESW